MARRWSTGFELQSVTNGMEWDTTVGSPTINTTIKRSGNASLRCNPTNSNAYLSYRYDSLFNTKDVYIRFYLYIATSTNALDIICMIREATFSTNICSIRLNSNRTLELWDDFNAVQIGSDSSALNIEQWYRVELFYDESDGSLNARINGTSFASGTGSLEQFNNQIQVGCISSTIADLYFDDIAINNNSGSDQNSWPGEGSIIHGYPNAAGDNNDCSAGDYTSIDDNPTPDDSSTKAVLDNDNDILDVNCENSSTIGLTSFDTITLVQVGVREAEVSAAQASWKLRIKSASGGTVTEGSITTHNDTTYRTNGDALPRLYTLTSYTDPTTSLAWTPTGTNSIDNMQIGIQAVDATPDTNVSTLWALIEYIPAGITTSTTTSVSTSTSTSTSSTTTSSSTTQSTSTSTSTSSTTTSSSTSTTQSTSSSTSTSSTTTSSSTTITTSSSTSTSSTTTSSSTSTTQSTSTSTSSTTTSSSTSSTTTSSSTTITTSTSTSTSTSSTTTSSSTSTTQSTSTSTSTSTSSTTTSSSTSTTQSTSTSTSSTTTSSSTSSTTTSTSSTTTSSSTTITTSTSTSSSTSTTTTLFFELSFNVNDVEETDNTTLVTDENKIEVGYFNSVIHDAGLRFQNITIPAGSDILSAVLTIDVSLYETTSQSYIQLVIKGDDSGNSIVWASDDRPSQREKTTASVNWDIASPDEDSPDIATVIEEIIRRGDWESGNALSLIIEERNNVNGNRIQFVTAEGDPTYGSQPVLAVQWSSNNLGTTTTSTTSTSTTISTSTSTTQSTSTSSTTTSSSTSTTQSTSTSTSSTTTSSSTSTSTSTSSTTTSSSTSTTTSSSTSTTQSTSTSTSSTTTSSSTSTSISTSSTTTSSSTSTTTSSSTSTTQSTSTSSTTTSSSTSTTQSTSTSSTTTSSSTSTTQSTSTSSTTTSSSTSTTTSSSTSTTQSTSTSSTTTSSSTSTTQSTSTSSTTISSSTSTTQSTSTSSTTTSSSTSTTISTSTSSTTTSSSTSTTQSTSTSSTTTSSSTSTTQSTSTSSTTTSSSISTTQSTSTSSTTTSSSTSFTTSSSTSTTQSISTSSTTTSSSTSITQSTSTSTTQSVTTSTSSTTTSSSTSTTISTSTTTTLNSLSGGLSFGEENPNQGESAISWQTWSDGSGGIPTIVGNQDWGKIDIDLSEEGRSQVYDFSNIELRLIILTENRYESGQGIATLQYRTSDSIFNQDDINPSWNNYSDQFLTVFRYMQIRIIKEL